MSEPNKPPEPGHLITLLNEGDNEKTAACLDRLGGADADARKRTIRMLRTVAEERPAVFNGLISPVSGFLIDEERSVRLTTAKLFVTLAQAEPAVVLPVVEALSDRLSDDDEFYFVRARCAEALGYVADEAPGEVTDPETLADLRLGLEFDEPEVKEKLAKALAYVALGDPGRLRHQVSSLADHLDDDNELVRYHLCTALVVIGCEQPEKLSAAESSLQDRLTDDNPYVRGRTAEALALLTASNTQTESTSQIHDIDADNEETPPFLTDRMRFLRRQVDDTESEPMPDGVGTVQSVRAGTDAVVEEMRSAGDDECPHCGVDLPERGPPMCPRCGAPR